MISMDNVFLWYKNNFKEKIRDYYYAIKNIKFTIIH